MTIVFEAECDGEWHGVAITDEGDLVPLEHDIEVEFAAEAMGAILPEQTCPWYFDEWNNAPGNRLSSVIEWGAISLRDAFHLTLEALSPWVAPGKYVPKAHGAARHIMHYARRFDASGVYGGRRMDLENAVKKLIGQSEAPRRSAESIQHLIFKEVLSAVGRVGGAMSVMSRRAAPGRSEYEQWISRKMLSNALTSLKVASYFEMREKGLIDPRSDSREAARYAFEGATEEGMRQTDLLMRYVRSREG